MVRRHRDNLTGEHDTADIIQLMTFIIFMALWVSDIFLRYSNFLNSHVPLVVRLPIGITLLVVSGYLAIAGLRILFGKQAQSMRVARHGVFGIVRHPIYLGEMMFYLGLLLINISLAAVSAWVIAVLFFQYMSLYEEKLLLSRFREEYRQYMKEVPMWLPRFRRIR